MYNYITHFKQKILESDIGSDKSFFFFKTFLTKRPVFCHGLFWWWVPVVLLEKRIASQKMGRLESVKHRDYIYRYIIIYIYIYICIIPIQVGIFFINPLSGVIYNPIFKGDPLKKLATRIHPFRYYKATMPKGRGMPRRQYGKIQLWGLILLEVFSF